MARHAPQYGVLVYIFQSDAETMKGNRQTTWLLFGLWTHSTSPVVQYICKSSESELKRKAESLGIELLGQCVPERRRYNNTRQLIIYNHGDRLEPEITGKRGDSDRNCSIKILAGVSPFSISMSGAGQRRELPPSNNLREIGRDFDNHTARVTYRKMVDTKRNREFDSSAPERRAPERAETVDTSEHQWYSTSEGTETLRKIREYCLRRFSQNIKIDMSRHQSTHDIQLRVEHKEKTFLIGFPFDFPLTRAHLSYIGPFQNVAVEKNDEIKNERDIVSAIKRCCGCYHCKYQ